MRCGSAGKYFHTKFHTQNVFCRSITVVKLLILGYNTIVGICPGGLMDKVMDSGSIDAGSIPARDARYDSYVSVFILCT